MSGIRTIRTLLIANRGEIACRIARTAKAMGIRTVAVYSEADASAQHVAAVDAAYPIGPAEAAKSYLDIPRLIETARFAGADAIHPGYGFLSENAGFAKACAEAGIVFVGPDVPAIEAMGSKAAAKEIMARAAVPLVPGYHGGEQDIGILKKEALAIGFPVLLKASAGGGGKGMRVVESEPDLEAEIAAAKREAKAAFGDDRMLIEKYLTRPRHVEVQVFADRHGNVVHLFERDCSVQRRHQKVVEEAPAPGLAEEIRSAMAEAAVNAAKAIDYVGAGTVEFIMDEDGSFYFMEMNTRLQVEHPVTEMITGQDLVAWQLRVAEGHVLPLSQGEIRPNGHAVEVRIYAEDPARDFLPQTGHLTRLAFPAEEDGIRVDSGVVEGDAVTVHYDPMIAKLIAHGRDRTEALRKLSRALEETRIAGLANNVAYLKRIVDHPAFAAGELDTRFIERHGADLAAPPRDEERLHRIAAAAAMEAQRVAAAEMARHSRDPFSPWALAHGWRLNDSPLHRITLLRDGEEIERAYRIVAAGYLFENDGDAALVTILPSAQGGYAVRIDGVTFEGELRAGGDGVTLFSGGAAHRYHLKSALASGADAGEDSGHVTAPMPGKLIAVQVAAGAEVSKGDPLMLLEAMKMEHVIRAPEDGVVAALHFAAGDQVEEGADLLLFEKAGGG
ncbi:acetyl-CoA carboxylase biotin carboxylase subunit [Nisaea acidiphila]|uniref:Acetyl-CoA carboxylase biotin carboxylase subunit n=1 Tax=Nisaea acidiphila TaxID=1862145 RepID=A0A9J7AZM8_9PROT|nr:acetyl-CoA carboxylase biotin carboxylase subunit [Nisaea acidiphila]UUX50901.1 acetyl-CoA carboxylase biotin carboxylase subunit [Nisaea acidiphila]